MSKRVRGYPLPSSDVYTEDVCPIAICIPNADWARHALYSSLRYLATWVAYQRDPNHMGKEAADSWKYALESMGGEDNIMCLNDLIDDVSAIKTLLQNAKQCCDQSITYGEGDSFTTEIVPGDGDPPEYYGETAITTWAEWEEHVCYNAHLWVDSLISKADQMKNAVQLGGLTIGAIGATLGLLSFVGLLFALPYGALLAILSALVIGATYAMFDDTAENLEASRNEIICALLQGNDVATVIEAALSSGLDWDLFYAYVNYGSATAIIYEGGADGQYLPAETRDDCECEAEYYYIYEFTAGAQNWTLANGFVYDGYKQALSGQVSSGDRWTNLMHTNIKTDLGLDAGATIKLVKLEADFFSYALACDYDIEVYVNDGTSTYTTARQTYTGRGSYGPIQHKIFASPTANNISFIGIKVISLCGGGNQFAFIDNVEIFVDEI